MGRRARIRIAAALVALTASAAGAQAGPLATAAGAAGPPAGQVARQAGPSCDGLASAPQPAYGWPVKPFHRQHPVRGYFGDPRIGGRPKGSVKAFHFGVDVSAPDGAAVYATTDGVARLERPGVVSIRRADGFSVFAYWHIEPAVHGGQRVTAYRTVIGHISEGWGHVHFAEYRGGVYLNPLRPGAMGPYRDRTCPAFGELRFERDGVAVAADSLSGRLDIVVSAYDMPARSAPAPWHELPVTPALLRWRILGSDGSVAVPWRSSYDVRETLPGVPYSAIYSDDTEQNRPNRAGHYRFVLARGFATASLAPGDYAVQALALDTHGNSARSSWPLVIGR
jgi:hypothetical protein